MCLCEWTWLVGKEEEVRWVNQCSRPCRATACGLPLPVPKHLWAGEKAGETPTSQPSKHNGEKLFDFLHLKVKISLIVSQEFWVQAAEMSQTEALTALILLLYLLIMIMASFPMIQPQSTSVIVCNYPKERYVRFASWGSCVMMDHDVLKDNKSNKWVKETEKLQEGALKLNPKTTILSAFGIIWS